MHTHTCVHVHTHTHTHTSHRLYAHMRTRAHAYTPAHPQGTGAQMHFISLPMQNYYLSLFVVFQIANHVQHEPHPQRRRHDRWGDGGGGGGSGGGGGGGGGSKDGLFLKFGRETLNVADRSSSLRGPSLVCWGLDPHIYPVRCRRRRRRCRR
jgi:hypothetical protein